jgi:hypothetical protein
VARKRAMSQREVDAIRKVGMTCVSDNLYLQIRDQGTRSGSTGTGSRESRR